MPRSYRSARSKKRYNKNRSQKYQRKKLINEEKHRKEMCENHKSPSEKGHEN